MEESITVSIKSSQQQQLSHVFERLLSADNRTAPRADPAYPDHHDREVIVD